MNVDTLVEKNFELQRAFIKHFFKYCKDYDYVMRIAKSLIAMNMQIGDKCSIYSYNRKEWFGCYSAMQMINSTSVAVYHTSSSAEVEWIVGNSDSKIVFVGSNPNDSSEKDKMPNHRLLAVLDNLKNIELVVFMDGIEKLKLVLSVKNYVENHDQDILKE